jgi:hypothetical protein
LAVISKTGCPGEFKPLNAGSKELYLTPVTR